MRCGEPVSLVAPCFSVYYDLVQRISSMRTYWLVFAAGLLTVGNLHAGLILQYETSNVGSTPTGDPIFRFTYFLSGGSLNAGDELEIDFDPALYGELSNASAGAGFDVALFQTNNPPGSTGVYSALAIVNNPSLATPFMTDAVYLGQGTPAPQPVFINQYDASGMLTSSTAIPTETQGVPEPSTLATTGALLVFLGCSRAVRRRFKRIT